MNWPQIDSSWTLFLDRDGVINRRIPGQYVEDWSSFEFLPGTREAIARFSKIFGHIVVVTNQQGIGKGLMTTTQLEQIHQQMLSAIQDAGGRIDAVYFCPDLSIHNPPCRKPNTGMGHQAKADFPTINFSKSVMVGDSASDIAFGRRLGMQLVLIEGKGEEVSGSDYLTFSGLKAFADYL